MTVQKVPYPAPLCPQILAGALNKKYIYLDNPLVWHYGQAYYNISNKNTKAKTTKADWSYLPYTINFK